MAEVSLRFSIVEHASVTYDNKLYLFGGYGYQYSDEIYVFDPSTEEYHKESSIVGYKPPGRSACSATVYKNYMYIFGG